jgi:hypothetical protein
MIGSLQPFDDLGKAANDGPWTIAVERGARAVGADYLFASQWPALRSQVIRQISHTQILYNLRMYTQSLP